MGCVQGQAASQAALNDRDPDGCTPLHLAVLNGAHAPAACCEGHARAFQPACLQATWSVSSSYWQQMPGSICPWRALRTCTWRHARAPTQPRRRLLWPSALSCSAKAATPTPGKPDTIMPAHSHAAHAAYKCCIPGTIWDAQPSTGQPAWGLWRRLVSCWKLARQLLVSTSSMHHEPPGACTDSDSCAEEQHQAAAEANPSLQNGFTSPTPLALLQVGCCDLPPAVHPAVGLYCATSLLMQDKHGNAPLHLAALGGHADVASLLLSTPAPPLDIRNKSGQLPAHCAALGGTVGVNQCLLQLPAVAEGIPAALVGLQVMQPLCRRCWQLRLRWPLHEIGRATQQTTCCSCAEPRCATAHQHVSCIVCTLWTEHTQGMRRALRRRGQQAHSSWPPTNATGMLCAQSPCPASQIPLQRTTRA